MPTSVHPVVLADFFSAADIGSGARGTVAEQACHPQRGSAAAVGVEGIDAVMHGGDKMTL